MNIAKIQFPVFQPYQTATLEIYVAGCKGPYCRGCHNPQLYDFSVGQNAGNRHLQYMIKRSHLFQCISILGGEPLDQKGWTFLEFIGAIQCYFPEKELWLFTGKELDEVPAWCLKSFQYIKTGRYIEDLQQEGFPASTNQKLLKRGVDY